MWIDLKNVFNVVEYYEILYVIYLYKYAVSI